MIVLDLRKSTDSQRVLKQTIDRSIAGIMRGFCIRLHLDASKTRPNCSLAKRVIFLEMYDVK